jgi:hypothetical protein
MHRKPFNGSIVYVASVNMPSFLDVFLGLPRSYRIVVVSGLEDVGVPWELWHMSRSEWSIIWNGKKPAVGMRDFILDDRLVAWYTQNYDLEGCNPFSCADKNEVSRDMLKKVHPIPIGLDFHSSAGKGDMSSNHFIHSVCKQRRELDKVRSELLSFSHRPTAALAAFHCTEDENYRATREDLCELLSVKKGWGHLNITHKTSGRTEFWRSLGLHAFALAPGGHGVDTHRLWEVLQMHSVPIVISSPMDRLYVKFPVVIVRSWKEVFVPGALLRFRQNIMLRFGEDPFESKQVLSMLTAKYWAGRIRSELL